MTEISEMCAHNSGLARQVAEAEADIIQATQAQNLAAIGATNDVGRSAQATATETRADINRINGDIGLAVSQSESRLATGTSAVGVRVEANGGDTRLSQAQSEGRLGLSISDGNSETRRVLSDVQMQLHSTLEARSAEIRQNQIRDAAAQVLEIERTKAESVLTRCTLERQSAENTAAIQLEAAKNAHALELAGERSKFELAKQVAECCCETQRAVHADGERTRALIEKNIIDSLRERVERAERDNDHHRHEAAVRVTVSQYMNQGNNFRPAAQAA